MSGSGISWAICKCAPRSRQITTPAPHHSSFGVVICLERGAHLHMAQLMPLPLTVSCFSKIQIGFTFLVPADPEPYFKQYILGLYIVLWPLQRFNFHRHRKWHSVLRVGSRVHGPCSPPVNTYVHKIFFPPPKSWLAPDV